MLDLFRLIFLLILFVDYFVLTGFQFREVWKPKTWFSKDRWYVLLIFAITTVTLIPSIFYRWFLIMGIDVESLKNLVTITNTINGLATMILINVIYFRGKFKKE
jgi:hypothetical protein